MALPSMRRVALLLCVAWLALAAGCGKNEGTAPKQAPVSSPPTPALPPPPAPLTPPSPAAPGATPTATTGTKSADPLAADRWYELMQDGAKMGSVHVEWSSSTWQGKPTLHDRTTQTTRSVRMMGETANPFSSTTVTDTERSLAGELWWTKSVTIEAGKTDRPTVSEATWTGNGYDLVLTLKGTVEKHRAESSLPTAVDVESFLGPRIAARKVREGDTLPMSVLDAGAYKVQTHTLTVLGTEPGPGVAGDVPCTKIRETEPDTGTESFLWLDAEGVFARYKVLAMEIRRASEGVARTTPARPASFSITAVADPPIERIFSADRVLVDVHMTHDPDRPLPDFPESPFSHVTGVEGSAAAGWTVHAVLTAYDSPDAKATIPVKDPAFAKDLEPTVLMPCLDPKVVARAQAIVGKETDARKAAELLALWVHDNLEKESSDIADTTAVEILDEMKGDCSEHAVLFVAMCRAVGIPARRCSGYVCVGSMWGAHAWAEIWTGAWIGADPTTSDVGTAARYLFFGKSEDPENHAGVVSGRARGRMRFVITHLDEGDDHIDIGPPSSYHAVNKAKGTAVHRLAGLDFRGIPDDWIVSWRGTSDGMIRGPKLFVRIRVSADQGDRNLSRAESSGMNVSTFAGAPVVKSEEGGQHTFIVLSRRRQVRIDATTEGPDAAAMLLRLEAVMAPSFTPKPKAP